MLVAYPSGAFLIRSQAAKAEFGVTRQKPIARQSERGPAIRSVGIG
jgi:hypothetical protein